jgi:hypothetical protein
MQEPRLNVIVFAYVTRFVITAARRAGGRCRGGIVCNTSCAAAT